MQFRNDAHGARKPRARSGRALRTEQSKREREAKASQVISDK